MSYSVGDTSELSASLRNDDIVVCRSGTGVLHKRDGLRVSVCAYCPWEIALNMPGWKGAREKPEPNSTKARAAPSDENSQQVRSLRTCDMRCIINAEGGSAIMFRRRCACARA